MLELKDISFGKSNFNEVMDENEKYLKEEIDIIDLGCGSGVIGITMKQKLQNANVDLIDISEKALEVANKNCGLLNSKAKTLQSNFFEHVNKKYDVVISNPPYIKNAKAFRRALSPRIPPVAISISAFSVTSR